jgi:PAS domain S-box-containing protein
MATHIARVSFISDSLLAIGFAFLMLALITTLLKRHDRPLFGAALALATLVFVSAAAHGLAALSYWLPLNSPATISKFLAAIASVAAAAAVLRLLPGLLEAPTARELSATNLALSIQVEQRHRSEQSLRDINTKLQAEMSQRDWDNRRFRLLVEAVPNYAILVLDPTGIVTSWNAGAEQIEGYQESEIVGQHFSRFYTDDDQAAGKPRNGLAMAAQNGRFEDEGWRVRKDGSLFWASVVITALRSPTGEILGYGNVTRDLTERRQLLRGLAEANEDLKYRVTERTERLEALAVDLEVEMQERKTAEESRREATELLEATFSAAPIPIMITGPASEVLMWNKAGEKTFGFTQDELLEKGYWPLVCRDGAEEAINAETVAPKSALNIMSRATCADGRILDIRVSTVPLLRRDGSARAVVSMIEDMTQTNQIEAQLRQSQKMEAIGTLTGGMAHDFNNLLSIIIGNLDVLREVRPEDSQVLDLAGEAIDAATRGADLTRSLLAFARRQPLRPVRLDLDVLIGGIIRLLGRLLGEHIEINLVPAENVCAIVADPAQLVAALTNLATNARDAMPRGGKLTIATGHRRLDAEYSVANPGVAPGTYAMIEVTDTGSGMSPDVKARVFEPFFTTKNERGSGLGLSMVFGFMKQSGGHISLYTEEGVGTTIRLYFPCSLVPDEGKINISSEGPLAGNGEAILVVEDSGSLRRIVVRQLRGLGYEVFEAADGNEALVVLETTATDLLFSDIIMPGGLDGFELADIALRKWPRLKVILTSGFPQSRFSAEFSSRSLPLLNKPYRKGDLAQLIRATLDSQTIDDSAAG